MGFNSGFKGLIYKLRKLKHSNSNMTLGKSWYIVSNDRKT